MYSTRTVYSYIHRGFVIYQRPDVVFIEWFPVFVGNAALFTSFVCKIYATKRAPEVWSSELPEKRNETLYMGIFSKYTCTSSNPYRRRRHRYLHPFRLLSRSTIKFSLRSTEA